MTKIELLVGSDAFWARAARDIASARRRLYVQAMSFEGDDAGKTVAGAIMASPARDRRVLVDAYSTVVISDRFVLSPAGLFDRALRAEAKATRAMFDDLVRAGARVRVTNPIGPLYLHYPARNHKKLIVADEAAYIGGINFSDHNFAWSDLMLRLEGEATARVLARDFEATFEGVARPWREDFGDLALQGLDGRSNARGFGEIIGLIEAAARAITVVSPYLTFPFTDALACAAKRGVAVTLITPMANNKPLLRTYLLEAARRAGFHVRLTPGMSHLKGLLIDDRYLVLGSSNFDFVSVAAEEELMAVIARPGVIADFRQRIIAPGLQNAFSPDAHGASRLAGWAARAALRIADLSIRRARLAPRSAGDWRARGEG
ncbi:MAG: phosphatidylserine/phosphatidylglycerophosphate/cardiolipin synthase family protein [Caulobacteraceae bacterium]|nr:phosphatidylserine/phosphatidylglycerophosphate/cardiolipin synthase family protein [Caulobacteraceae bacterium]